MITCLSEWWWRGRWWTWWWTQSGSWSGWVWRRGWSWIPCSWQDLKHVSCKLQVRVVLMQSTHSHTVPQHFYPCKSILTPGKLHNRSLNLNLASISVRPLSFEFIFEIVFFLSHKALPTSLCPMSSAQSNKNCARLTHHNGIQQSPLRR